MTDYLKNHAVVIETNGRELTLDRDDLKAFHAVNEVFPGSRAVLLRQPGEPPRPIFSTKQPTQEGNK